MAAGRSDSFSASTNGCRPLVARSLISRRRSSSAISGDEGRGCDWENAHWRARSCPSESQGVALLLGLKESGGRILSTAMREFENLSAEKQEQARRYLEFYLCAAITRWARRNAAWGLAVERESWLRG